MEGLLTAKQVSEMTGVKYGTLLGWLREGFVHAEIYPRKRWRSIWFTPKEAEHVAKVAKQRQRACAVLWPRRKAT